MREIPYCGDCAPIEPEPPAPAPTPPMGYGYIDEACLGPGGVALQRRVPPASLQLVSLSLPVIALLAALVLVSPAPKPDPVCLWWSRTERRCRDADMEILGSWNPIPLDYAPPTMGDFGYGSSEPREWGSYRTEQPRASSWGEK